MFPHHKAGFVDNGCVPGWWMWQGLLLCTCRGVEFVLRSGSLSPVMVPAKVPSFSSRSVGCVGSHADVPFSWLAVWYCLLSFYTVSEPPKSTLPCSPSDHWETVYGELWLWKAKVCESLEMVPEAPGEHCGLGKDGSIFYHPSKVHTDIWPTLPCILTTHRLDWKLASYMLSYIFWIQFSDPQTNSGLWLSLNDK